MYLTNLNYLSKALHLVSQLFACRQGNKFFFRRLCRSRLSVRYLTDVTYVEKRLSRKIINQILRKNDMALPLFSPP